MTALADILGPSEARAWLKEARLEPAEDGWVLTTASRFIASWIGTHFDQALRRAAAAAGLARPPAIRARPPGPAR
jgi:chromosomal replication initiation ATPase DnaA